MFFTNGNSDNVDERLLSMVNANNMKIIDESFYSIENIEEKKFK